MAQASVNPGTRRRRIKTIMFFLSLKAKNDMGTFENEI